MQTHIKPVIFYDGYCNLCISFIRIISKLDKKNKIDFLPLDKNLLKEVEEHVDNPSTVIFQKKNIVYKKSRACIESLYELGGVYKCVVVFYIIPKPFLDWIYDLIAENRYKLFGKRNSCYIPVKKEK